MKNGANQRSTLCETKRNQWRVLRRGFNTSGTRPNAFKLLLMMRTFRRYSWLKLSGLFSNQTAPGSNKREELGEMIDSGFKKQLMSVGSSAALRIALIV